MKRPNLFIIGAPKCGTTALSEYLGTHPNIFISTLKEPEYFAFDFANRGVQELDLYLSLFAEADPSIHKVVGEGSTCYLFSKDAVAEILRFNGDAKIIVMIRNPIELVHSLHSELIFQGREDIVDFETAWRAEADRKQGGRIPRFCGDSKWLMYSEWGQLGEQVERLLSVAGREGVKILLFEDFVKDTPGVYEEVLQFLGVSSDGRRAFPRVNANKKVKFPVLQGGMVVLEKKLFMLKMRFGLTGVRFGIGRNLFSMLSEFTERSPISDRLHQELCQFYADDVEKLSRLTGRDLSHWLRERRSLLVGSDT